MALALSCSGHARDAGRVGKGDERGRDGNSRHPSGRGGGLRDRGSKLGGAVPQPRPRRPGDRRGTGCGGKLAALRHACAGPARRAGLPRGGAARVPCQPGPGARGCRPGAGERARERGAEAASPGGDRCPGAARDDRRQQHLGPPAQPHRLGLPSPEPPHRRPPVQPAAPHAAGRDPGRRRSGRGARLPLLCGAGPAAAGAAQGDGGPPREPAGVRPLPRGGTPDRAGCRERGGCGCRGEPRAGAALGDHGSMPDLSPGRRGRRDHPLSRASGPSQARRWASLGNPSFGPEMQARIADGVLAEAAGRTVEELEAERDRALVGILRLLGRGPGGDRS
jgi:hypothetical protein